MINMFVTMINHNYVFSNYVIDFSDHLSAFQDIRVPLHGTEYVYTYMHKYNYLKQKNKQIRYEQVNILFDRGTGYYCIGMGEGNCRNINVYNSIFLQTKLLTFVESFSGFNGRFFFICGENECPKSLDTSKFKVLSLLYMF